MPGLPARRLAAENPVLDRPLAERDEGIDAARIGLEHRLGLSAEQGEIPLRGGRAVHLPRENIAGHRACAEPFGVSPGAASQQRFHLPEPVLRLCEAEPGEGILEGLAADMWNAPFVAPDVDVGRQAVDLRGAAVVGEVIGWIDAGRCCGHWRSGGLLTLL